MAVDSAFRTRLRALIDLIAESDTRYDDARSVQFPMPWGKAGLLKVRLAKEGGQLVVRFTRKGGGESPEE
jgi:hypothetical protein